MKKIEITEAGIGELYEALNSMCEVEGIDYSILMKNHKSAKMQLARLRKNQLNEKKTEAAISISQIEKVLATYNYELSFNILPKTQTE